MADNAHKEYYHHIHLMRGFASAWIVATHATSMPFSIARQDGAYFPLAYEIRELLFHNSTIFFALISGLVYALILHKKSSWDFYRNKIKNVVVPYLIISALYTSVSLVILHGVELPKNIGPAVWRYVSNAANGTSVGVLWYIPVALVLFFFSPLAWRTLRSKAGAVFLTVVLVAPFASGRVGLHLTWNNVVYFAAPYILGMWIGINYNRHTSLLRRYWWVLASLAIVASAWQISATTGVKLSVHEDWRSGSYYIQKMSLAMLLLLAFQKTEGLKSPWLEHLGNVSFALYFLHMIPIKAVRIFLDHVDVQHTLSITIASGIGLTPIAILSTLLIIKLIQQLLGNRSRYVIGS